MQHIQHIQHLQPHPLTVNQVRKLAAALGTDSSILYRHFRNKTELLRAVVDRILLAAMDGHRPEGDWKQRVTALAHFARGIRPLGADRRAAFEEILAAQLAHIEAR
ncbi:TetR family transcriptional regulator [Streptomyces sp. AB3(2024)]|uniref:TetR family transcriptional regulator n=1 Tax=Streptomyces sp. AB3(2024) TaxID=3317321 RepID=UPI0035A3B6C2